MTTLAAEADVIRVQPCAACPICGATGRPVYSGQRDRMFDAPGRWSLKRCSNDRCRLAWLDPMPIAADIGKAYTRYYTHAPQSNAQAAGAIKRLFLHLKSDYLATRYGYPRGALPLPLPLTGHLLAPFPLRRAEADAEVRFLDAVSNGQLLDVGCGSGDWLLAMRERGWQVTGVDFDAGAVAVGRQRGLRVRCGPLEDQRFPDESFDAITLNHVIEHVPDPVRTLQECARVLRRGGRLVVSTPNADSLSHHIYKQDWRGLEPPRHLHIFSFDALRDALALAGLRTVRLLPQVADSILYESHLLRHGWTGSFVGARRRWMSWIAARGLATAELLLVKWRPSMADAVTAIAVK